jgi:hypothetical protein
MHTFIYTLQVKRALSIKEDALCMAYYQMSKHALQGHVTKHEVPTYLSDFGYVPFHVHTHCVCVYIYIYIYMHMHMHMQIHTNLHRRMRLDVGMRTL